MEVKALLKLKTYIFFYIINDFGSFIIYNEDSTPLSGVSHLISFISFFYRMKNLQHVHAIIRIKVKIRKIAIMAPVNSPFLFFFRIY